MRLANEDEKNAKEIIDSSRLVSVSDLYMDFVLAYDVTKNPELKENLEKGTKLIAYWAEENISSFTNDEIKEQMNGYALYMARNYRSKGAYLPREN